MQKTSWIPFNILIIVTLVEFYFVTDAKWILVWSDEFDGQELKSTKWMHDVGCTGKNGELQCHTNRTENVKVQQGVLKIEVQVEEFPHGASNFTSGRIRSRRAWTFGKFEIRARLPSGHHLWPSILLLPKNRTTYGDWAASGEIDIVEARGDQPNEIMGNIHYGGIYPNSITSSSGERQFMFDFSRKFHKFALEWNRKSIEWFVDGVRFHRESIDKSMWSGKGEDPNPYTRNGQPFDQPFYLILNVAVGGTLFGAGPYVSPEQAQHWSKPTMEVDYVRVWKWKSILK